MVSPPLISAATTIIELRFFNRSWELAPSFVHCLSHSSIHRREAPLSYACGVCSSLEASSSHQSLVSCSILSLSISGRPPTQWLISAITSWATLQHLASTAWSPISPVERNRDGPWAAYYTQPLFPSLSFCQASNKSSRKKRIKKWASKPRESNWPKTNATRVS